MSELGISENLFGADDPRAGKTFRTFDPDEKTGGSLSTGIVVDSGALNPDLLNGKKGSGIWSRSRLRDRIDAIIAHEWAEAQTLDHEGALTEAARTLLPISPGARRILKAMEPSQ